MMKQIKILVLVGLIFGFFQAHLFSTIPCRIEGVVIDKDTGLPLVGAKVVLFYCPVGAQNFSFSYPDNKSISINVDDPDYMALRTDSKGFFRYEDRKEGEYFLCVFKPGYASYGQIREARLIEMAEGYDMDVMPKGSIAASFVKERFFLKERKNKHFCIEMEKGSVLEVKILRKISAGIEEVQITRMRGLIRIRKEGESEGFYIYSNREDGLPACVPFLVHVDIGGYPAQTYRVILEKWQTTTVTHTMDFTVGQVIYGVVSSKKTGRPLKNVDVNIHMINVRKYSPNTSTNEKGEYWIGGIEAGTYLVSTYTDNGLVGGKVEVKLNEKVEFNYSF